MSIHDKIQRKLEPTQPDAFIHKSATIDGLETGLTKREYFAAMALSGLASLIIPGMANSEKAEKAVLLADALISQLNNGALK